MVVLWDRAGDLYLKLLAASQRTVLRRHDADAASTSRARALSLALVPTFALSLSPSLSHPHVTS
jgi:hypothetical protein